MKEERHIIWTDYGLDYEDWRDDLEADYPDLSEDERISLMYGHPPTSLLFTHRLVSRGCSAGKNGQGNRTPESEG